MELLSVGETCDIRINGQLYAVQRAIFKPDAKSVDRKELAGYLVCDIIHVGTSGGVAYFVIPFRDPLITRLIKHAMVVLNVSKFAAANLDVEDAALLGMSPSLANVSPVRIWETFARLFDESAQIYRLCVIGNKSYPLQQRLQKDFPIFQQITELIAKYQSPGK